MECVSMKNVLILNVKMVSPEMVLDVLTMMNVTLHIPVITTQNALILLVGIHVVVKTVSAVMVCIASQHHVDLANMEPAVMIVIYCLIMLMMTEKAVLDAIQALF